VQPLKSVFTRNGVLRKAIRGLSFMPETKDQG
jgi:hypothetical protein